MVLEKYTRSLVIESVAQKTDLSQKDVKLIIDCLFDDLKDALINKKIVELRGFGTFAIKIRKGRKKARNPKTGEPVEVCDHGVVVFKPGKELKQDVWKIGEE
jgi:integration host factor subunit beta